jgi:hypothetical protein
VTVSIDINEIGLEEKRGINSLLKAQKFGNQNGNTLKGGI